MIFTHLSAMNSPSQQNSEQDNQTTMTELGARIATANIQACRARESPEQRAERNARRRSQNAARVATASDPRAKTRKAAV